MFPTSVAYLVQLVTTIIAEGHTGEDWHFSHRCEPTSAIPDFLNYLVNWLLDDLFVGIPAA